MIDTEKKYLDSPGSAHMEHPDYGLRLLAVDVGDDRVKP